MLASIKGHIDAAVIAIDHVPWMGGVDPDVVVVDVHVVLGNGNPVGPVIGAFQEGDPSNDHPGGIRRVNGNESEVVTITVADLVESLFVGSRPSSVSAGVPLVDFGANDRGVKHFGIGVAEVIGQGIRFQFPFGDTFKNGGGRSVFWESVVRKEVLEGCGVEAGKVSRLHAPKGLGFEVCFFCVCLFLFGLLVLIVHNDVKAVFASVMCESDASDSWCLWETEFGGRQVGPRLTAIDGFIDTAAPSVLGEGPRPARAVPECCVEVSGSVFVDHQVHGASFGSAGFRSVEQSGPF